MLIHPAAMRLRQLASTQSIVFFSPPEVHSNILDLCGNRFIDSSHVVHWLLEQTCVTIEQLQPLYYSQGLDFCRRVQALTDNPDFIKELGQRETLLKILKQNERQTLEQLYAPRTKSTKVTKDLVLSSRRLIEYANELNDRRKGFEDTGSAVHGSVLEEVEQEREVAFEIEAVREVQKPVRYKALNFDGLHRDVHVFATKGVLVADSPAYEHYLMTLSRTALGRKHGITVSAFSTLSRLYVTTQFERTVRMPQGEPNDNFIVSCTIVYMYAAVLLQPFTNTNHSALFNGSCGARQVKRR